MPSLEGKNSLNRTPDDIPRPSPSQSALILAGATAALLLVLAGIFWSALQNARSETAELRQKLEQLPVRPAAGPNLDMAPHEPGSAPLDRLAARVGALEVEMKDLGSAVSEHGKRLDMIEGREDGQDKKLQVLGDQVQKHDAQLSDLKNVAKDHAGQLQKDQTELAAIKSKLDVQDRVIQLIQRKQRENESH